jgi:hypothetical protein
MDRTLIALEVKSCPITGVGRLWLFHRRRERERREHAV